DSAPLLVTYDGARWARSSPAPEQCLNALESVLGGATLNLRGSVTPGAVGPALTGSGLRSLIAAPLSGAAGTLGALFLATREKAGFSAEDGVVLGLCADRVAIAVEHARSYERERGVVEVLQHHL